ncbi:MAG: LacI family transcriptional regulator [Chloroflexi bacterium 44-23]|nr:MAG: LacI family transcriptional regulator [Chloroflexi bacterium 44-23]
MSTIREVAEQANVSITTVSHVVNNTRFVSSEVKNRVLIAMEEIGYQPNELARSLRMGQTHTIGLILPDSANPFFAEVGHHVESAAFAANYNVILCNTEGLQDKEKIYVDVLLKKQVDGIIFVAAGDRPESLYPLIKHKHPVVLIDRNLSEMQYAIDSVFTDNYQGGYRVTKHLLAIGHQNIGCIMGPHHLSPSMDRVVGFRNALHESGFSVNEDIIVQGDFHPTSGYKAALEILTNPSRPTAIFAFNDLMAIGVIRAASEKGLRVPQDLAVVGFDDIELTQYVTPSLTTMAQPKLQMGMEAVRLLTERMQDNSLPAQTIMLETKLIVRDSCGAKLKRGLSDISTVQGEKYLDQKD